MDDRLLLGRRVLVVEDEMLVLMAMEDMLADLGCTSVMAAATVEKALALIETESFDLATLDLNLGGCRSNPIAKALNDHGIRFAFSTGYGEHGFGETLGDRPLLKKPFSLAQLASVLTGIILSADDSRALPA